MKRIFLFVTLLAITTVASSQKTYNLQFKPKQGEKYDAFTTSKATITQSVMGQEMVMGMDYDITTLYEIGKEGNNTALNMTYDKMVMTMDAMGQKVEMSSDDPDESNPASKGFRALKGAKVSVILNANGEVMDVKGTDELANKFGGMSEMEKETLKSFISKESLKGTTEMTMKIFPGKPVKVGDTWTVVSSIETPYKLTSNNTYKLVKVENGVAFLDVTGTVSTGGAQTMKSGGMEMTVDLAGEQNGTLQVDEATGLSKNARIKQNLKGKMGVMGQDVPMTVVSDTKVVLKKK